MQLSGRRALQAIVVVSAAALLGAGMPALLASAAGPAGPTSQVRIVPNERTGAAGDCLVYNVVVGDRDFSVPSDTATVSVNVEATPATTGPGAAPTVTFCDPQTRTAIEGSSSSPGSPARAVATPTDRSQGVFAFGVIGSAAGTADLLAYADAPNAGAGRRDPGEPYDYGQAMFTGSSAAEPPPTGASPSPSDAPTSSASPQPTATTSSPPPSASAAGPAGSGAPAGTAATATRPSPADSGNLASPLPSSTSPRPTPTSTPSVACALTPVISASPALISSGGSTVISGRATAGSRIQLVVYSRPSTTYRVTRESVVGDTGTFRFLGTLTSNTRLYVQEAGCATNSARSIVISVRAVVTVSASRAGARRLTFTGGVSPRRAGQLVSLYLHTASGDRLLGQVRTTATGAYTLQRSFPSRGPVTVLARTGSTVVNLTGSSSRRVTVS